jgi:hypothetical protein
MPTQNPMAQDPGPIELTETQIDNYLVRPEFFQVRKYFDPISEPFHKQSKNSPEAQERSRDPLSQGSVRADGNVNHAGLPHST